MDLFSDTSSILVSAYTRFHVLRHLFATQTWLLNVFQTFNSRPVYHKPMRLLKNMNFRRQLSAAFIIMDVKPAQFGQADETVLSMIFRLRKIVFLPVFPGCRSGDVVPGCGVGRTVRKTRPKSGGKMPHAVAVPHGA